MLSLDKLSVIIYYFQKERYCFWFLVVSSRSLILAGTIY